MRAIKSPNSCSMGRAGFCRTSANTCALSTIDRSHEPSGTPASILSTPSLSPAGMLPTIDAPAIGTPSRVPSSRPPRKARSDR